MWIVCILSIIISCVCENVAVQAVSSKTLTDDSRKKALIAVVIDVSIGILLYMIAEFSMRFYEYTELEFWNRGKITAEGVLYFGMKLCGALVVISGLIITGTIWVKDITSALSNNNYITRERTAGTTIEKSVIKDANRVEYPSAPMPQDKIPAWKRVEMEHTAEKTVDQK